MTISRAQGESAGEYTITTSGDAVQGNYEVIFNTGTFKITPAAIRIVAEKKTKVYDNDSSTDPLLTAVVSNKPSGGDEPVYSVTRVTGQNAGDYNISVIAEAAANPNYMIASEGNTFHITPAAITITPENKEKVYDNDPSTDPLLTAEVKNKPEKGADPVYELGRVAGQEAGGHKITVLFDQEVNSNYTITTEDGNFLITKASITITPENKEKVFDNDPSTDPLLTAEVKNKPEKGVDPVFELSRVAGQNAGKYTISVDAPDSSNPNYEVKTETGTFTINKKAISVGITVTGEYSYTGSAIIPSYTVTDSETGEVLDAADFTAAFSNNINAGEDTAGITITETEKGNYTFDPAEALFSIAKAAAPVLPDITMTLIYTADSISASTSGRMPEDAGTLVYAKGSESSTGRIRSFLPSLMKYSAS